MMKKIILFWVVLVLLTFQFRAFAAVIPSEYFDSLPGLRIQENVDLSYDFKAGTFIWLNNSVSVARLVTVELLESSTTNEFSKRLPNNPADLLATLPSFSKANGQILMSGSSVSLDNLLSVIISNLNKSKKTTTNQSIPVPLPASMWLVIAGLLGLIAQLSKNPSDYKPQSPKQPELVKSPKNSKTNELNQQKKVTGLTQLKILTRSPNSIKAESANTVA